MSEEESIDWMAMSSEESDEEPTFIGMVTEEESERLRLLRQGPKRNLLTILRTINTGKGGTEDLKVAKAIYDMENLDLTPVDSMTDLKGEVNKLMSSYGIR